MGLVYFKQFAFVAGKLSNRQTHRERKRTRNSKTRLCNIFLYVGNYWNAKALNFKWKFWNFKFKQPTRVLLGNYAHAHCLIDALLHWISFFVWRKRKDSLNSYNAIDLIIINNNQHEDEDDSNEMSCLSNKHINNQNKLFQPLQPNDNANKEKKSR